MVEGEPTRQQAVVEEAMQAENVKMKQPMAEQEPEALTSNTELVELLEAELEADYCCPLTLVCSLLSRLYSHAVPNLHSRQPLYTASFVSASEPCMLQAACRCSLLVY